MSGGVVAEFTKPEHLGDPFLGVWHAAGLLTQSQVDRTMTEVYNSGLLEPIRRDPAATVNQDFERMEVDFTREHGFPELEEMGLFLGRHFVRGAARLFPAAERLTIDDATVQVYTQGAKLALGWHRDHPKDEIVIINAVCSGRGVVGFTEKTVPETKQGVAEEDIIAKIHTQARDAQFFRSTGLFVPEDGGDIRKTHAVLEVDDAEPRFTVQYRMGVNGAAFGNIPVNADAPLRERPPLLIA